MSYSFQWISAFRVNLLCFFLLLSSGIMNSVEWRLTQAAHTCTQHEVDNEITFPGTSISVSSPVQTIDRKRQRVPVPTVTLVARLFKELRVSRKAASTGSPRRKSNAVTKVLSGSCRFPELRLINLVHVFWMGKANVFKLRALLSPDGEKKEASLGARNWRQLQWSSYRGEKKVGALYELPNASCLQFPLGGISHQVPKTVPKRLAS